MRLLDVDNPSKDWDTFGILCTRFQCIGMQRCAVVLRCGDYLGIRARDSRTPIDEIEKPQLPLRLRMLYSNGAAAASVSLRAGDDQSERNAAAPKAESEPESRSGGRSTRREPEDNQGFAG